MDGNVLDISVSSTRVPNYLLGVAALAAGAASEEAAVRLLLLLLFLLLLFDGDALPLLGDPWLGDDLDTTWQWKEHAGDVVTDGVTMQSRPGRAKQNEMGHGRQKRRELRTSKGTISHAPKLENAPRMTPAKNVRYLCACSLNSSAVMPANIST